MLDNVPDDLVRNTITSPLLTHKSAVCLSLNGCVNNGFPDTYLCLVAILTHKSAVKCGATILFICDLFSSVFLVFAADNCANAVELWICPAFGEC